MIYTRQQHWQFLEAELIAQTEAFRQKLETPALFLFHYREEIFLSHYIRFERAELIAKFPGAIPRIGEYLYAFTLPPFLSDPKNWKGMTYGELIKCKINYTEMVCVWHGKSNVGGTIAGFRRAELAFCEHINETRNQTIILGPNPPPFQYLMNLQDIVLNNSNEAANEILDYDYRPTTRKPKLLDDKKNLADHILGKKDKTIIIQGPPGTGKTTLIAKMCQKLLSKNYSVLVSALTNRALLEAAMKPVLKDMLKEGRIFKTVLTVDEAHQCKNLKPAAEIRPIPGKLLLSTYFIASSLICNGEMFDYVILDEASQAPLSMFACAKRLGRKFLWLGDTKQSPPIIAISEDKITRRGYGALVNGLQSISANLPVYQLTTSHRLTERAAAFTGIFYGDTLKSKAKPIKLFYDSLPEEYQEFFHPEGGPSLITMDMPVGDYKPKEAIGLIVALVRHLMKEKIHVSALTYFVETTKALQKELLQAVGHNKNVLVETVARAQGLTTDVAIFLIPNASYHRSLETRIFNVATSRSLRHTLIIADENILRRAVMDDDVRRFISKIIIENSTGIL
jgi:DNA replication ATP-dependent helicase Dna2